MKARTLEVFLSLLSFSLIYCAPNDPSSGDHVQRLTTGHQQRLLRGGDTPFFPPFTLDSANSSITSSKTFLIHQAENGETAHKTELHDYQSDDSPSFLKPALFIGGALALTGIMIRTDQTTYDILHRWRVFSDPLEDTSPVITNLGDGRASMAIFGGLLAYSYLGNDRMAFQAGKIGLESFLVSGIVTQILKHTFGRQRPSTATVSGGRWNGAYFLLNQGSGKRGGYASFDAFPSGHTATIFAAATTLAEVYHDSPWVSYVSYTVASGVAVSRVMERAHWVSDCFVGGIIGYYSAQLVLHYNRSDKPVVFVPLFDGRNVQLALTIGF